MAPKADMTCTPTEAIIVQYDIDRGNTKAAGPSDMNSCYLCLAENSCLDDTHLGDSNQECEDPVITTGTVDECHAVMHCVFDSNKGSGTCAKASAAVCYCGTAVLTSTCQGNPSQANGVCDVPIAAGLGFPTLDGTSNTSHFTDGYRAGGVADQIFSCAHTAGCTKCFD
jgi:hypothetical protein